MTRTLFQLVLLMRRSPSWCLCRLLTVLQGSGGGEELLDPDQAQYRYQDQAQQPVPQHSFVKELFQAQYK